MTKGAIMTATAKEGQWHVSIDGKQKGPYDLEQMKQMAREGRLPANAAVWCAGMDNWQHWRKVPELGISPTVESSIALSGGTQTALVDFLVFRRMVAPLLLMILFWIGTVAGLLGGLYLIYAAVRADTIRGVLFGLLVMVLTPVVVRLYCEVMIILFRINETLTDIKNLNLKR
jgi:hypothetical protein